MDKKTLLDRAASSPEERILLAHVLDECERCRLRGQPGHTPFLSPAEQRASQDLLRAAAVHEGYVFCGGYERAERRMLCFLPEWQEESGEGELIRALRVHYYESLTHRDLLGSLMGLGVRRGALGDILAGERSADVLCEAAMAPFLLQEWRAAGRVALRAEEISLGELNIPAQRVRELRDTVASLRLDAVTGCGFSLSRAKAAELVESGRVQLNYRETTRCDAAVAEGDVISARGLGKFTLASVGGKSKKGRTAIVLRRYL